MKPLFKEPTQSTQGNSVPPEFIEAHANDIVRGDNIDLDFALNLKLAKGVLAESINPDIVTKGDLAEVVNVSFRRNHMTRLKVRFADQKFNLTYHDDDLLMVRESEQDKLERR